MSPNPLTPDFAASKNALASNDPLVFLYEFEVPTTPQQRVRLTTHDEEVIWRGNTYSRAPLLHTEVVEDTEGNLPVVNVTVPNSSREIAAVMDSYSGLTGQPVRVTLISLEDITSGQPVLEQDYQIADGHIDEHNASFRLQVFNPHRATLPGGRVARQSCWYKYRSKRCGFALTEADTGGTTCDHSYDGENGCTAKGALYVAEGLTAIHPDRFGGFRSVPKQKQGGGI